MLGKIAMLELFFVVALTTSPPAPTASFTHHRPIAPKHIKMCAIYPRARIHACASTATEFQHARRWTIAIVWRSRACTHGRDVSSTLAYGVHAYPQNYV